MPDINTVEEFITSNPGNSQVTYYNFSILQQEVVNGDDIIQFVESNIIDDYIDEMRDASATVTLDKSAQIKYYYNPGLLAYDLYGSTELEFVILKLNGIIDPKEFDIPNVRLLTASVLSEFLSTIYNAERSYINKNRELNGIEMA